MTGRITLAEIGHALILMAFLLAVAGIVQPSAAVCAAIAAFTITGFAIGVVKAHHDWREGYGAGRYESSVERLEAKLRQREETKQAQVTGEPLFKCGQKSCYCVKDGRFKEWSDD